MQLGAMCTQGSARHVLKVETAAPFCAVQRAVIQASDQDFAAVTGEGYVRRPQNSPCGCGGRLSDTPAVAARKTTTSPGCGRMAFFETQHSAT